MGRLRSLGVAVAIATAWTGTIARAQEAKSALPSPLTLEVVTKLARDDRSEIEAARQRTRAGWARANAEGKPPDPMLMTNLDHLPLPEVMGADASFMIQQSIPLSGELGARIRRAEWFARALEEDEKTVRLDVELDAANAFLMLAEEQAMTAVVDKQIAVVESLEKIIETRLSTGAGTPADLLRAGLERSRLEVERDTLARRIKASDAMLDAALGRNPNAEVPVCELPSPGPEPVDGAALARTALAERPELTSMRKRVRAAEEDVEVMRNMRAPMGVFGLGAAYTMTDGFGLMATVGISIPIWEDKYDSAIDEAKAMASMERAEVRAMQTMVSGAVVAARERVEAARERELAIRKKLIPLGDQVLKALLTSYTSGQTSVVAVIDGYQSVQMIEMEHVSARAELGRARAQLARKVGTGGGRTGSAPASD
ncbi:MAG: TolC family protein [Polyangiaceae bacterium]|nr:TolC family protein [Polyangiaceae bacterium]